MRKINANYMLMCLKLDADKKCIAVAYCYDESVRKWLAFRWVSNNEMNGILKAVHVRV